MNDALIGTSLKDVGRDIQQLTRENKKLERKLNTMGTPSDTDSFRMELRDDIHQTTALVKHLLSCIQDLKSQEPDNNVSMKLQRAEKQFLDQYTKLSNLTKRIKLGLESSQPSHGKSSSLQSSTSTANRNTRGNVAAHSGGYDLAHIDMDHMEHFENHPDIPMEEEEEGALKQSQAFIPQFDGHLQELEQREEAIHQMADDLTELNSMYKDLHGLVNEQGEQIEVLASNVESAKEDVKSGVVHLDAAAGHQRRYRKKMCIMLMIVLVMALVLTLAIYYGLGKRTKH